MFAVTSLSAQEVAVSPSNDPFIAAYKGEVAAIPALMYFPTPPPGTSASAAFEFNTTSSPLVAVNPVDAKSIVIAMNQDPFLTSDGSSSVLRFFRTRFQEVNITRSSDGAKSWQFGNVPLNVSLQGKLSDGVIASALKYSSSGKHLFLSGRFNDLRPGIQGRSSPLSGIWLCQSSDDGASWTENIVSTQGSDADMGFTGVADGHPDLAVDPTNDEKAYLVWDRPKYVITEFFGSPTPLYGNLYFSRTKDGGAHWDAPKEIYDMSSDLKIEGQCTGAALIMTNKHSLIASCLRYYPMKGQPFNKTYQTTITDRVIIRSTDGGTSWDKKATVV